MGNNVSATTFTRALTHVKPVKGYVRKHVKSKENVLAITAKHPDSRSQILRGHIVAATLLPAQMLPRLPAQIISLVF